MTSPKQIKANRENAKKSTGPRTVAGKLRSRRNSLMHGLTAKTLLIAGETEAEFNKLRAAVYRTYDPHDQLEAELVEGIVADLWRLRRVLPFEAAAFEFQTALWSKTSSVVASRSCPTQQGRYWLV
jgi:hypothetical protein